MKRKIFLFTFSLLSYVLITSCNNRSDKSKADTLNNETKNSNKMNDEQLVNFGNKYSEAWCSQKPESVAAFFSTDGSLKVNADSPAVGREAITKVAQGFMTAFPDMIVAMDSLVTKSNGIEFHWTLTGTNSGPGGTGNKVKVSGFEVWKFSETELIQESIGSFDADEYNRQLKTGVK
jgi:SnoaL-like polyketide cyclase